MTVASVMSSTDLKEALLFEFWDIHFTFNGLPCGVEVEVHDSIPSFEGWYGNTSKKYTNVDMLIHDKFFGGKSLQELEDIVEFSFY